MRPNARSNGRDHSEGGRRRTRRHRIGVALALAAAVFAAACSSNSSNSSNNAGTNSSGTANTAAGSTLNIGEIADLTGPTTFPGGADGAKAAIAAVNKAGGINGHGLKLIVCDSQGNPNVAAECANQMVSSHVVYVDDDHSNEGDSFMPVLRSAGIPVVMGEPIGADDFSFPNSYILGSGTATVGGAGAMCAKLGSTRIGIAQLDIAGLTSIVNLIYKTIAPFGLSKANTSITLIPPTAVDLSTYAAALIQKSTCIVEVLAPNQQVPLAAAIHSQNPAIPVVATGTATLDEWQKIGKLADNVCENASLPPAALAEAPGMAQYNAEMDTYNKSGRRDNPSISGWASVHLAAKVLAKVANPSAATYMQALNTAGTINLPPVPPTNFTRPVSLIPGITRLMSEDVVYYRHVSGGVTSVYGGQYTEIMSLKSAPSVSTAPHC